MKKIIVSLISLIAIDSLCTKLTAPEYATSIAGAATTALLLNDNSVVALLKSLVVGLIIFYSMVAMKAVIKKIEQKQGLKSTF